MQNKLTSSEGRSSDLTTDKPASRGADCSRCIVHGCRNHRHQGRFIGDLCAPCHSYITTGRVGPTTSFLGKLDGMMDALKTISVSDWKTAGELRKMARDAYSSANVQAHRHGGEQAAPASPTCESEVSAPNDEGGVVFGGAFCSSSLSPVKVYDTGLSENELETLRAFIRLQHPEMDGHLLFPSKDSVHQNQADSFEFCQAPNADEFHEEHRQLYIRAKQYMDFLDNPTLANFELLEREVQDLLRREGKIPCHFLANAQNPSTP